MVSECLRAGAAALALCLGGAALASDLPARKDVLTLPVPETWNPWMIRVRALGVLPDESARLKSGGARLTGAGVDISNSVVPELDITYFFTKNWATELVLGVTRHQVTGTGVLDNARIGNTWLLPPTLTLQYHFTDFGAFKPYLGVGVNYTVYFDEEARGQFTHFRLNNTAGLALQAGADFMLDEHWGINVDVKKILIMEPDVSLNHRAVTGHVTIDPWLVATGITYKF